MFDAASTDSEMHDLANVEVGPETKGECTILIYISATNFYCRFFVRI